MKSISVCFLFGLLVIAKLCAQPLATEANKLGLNFGTMVTKIQFKTAPASYKQTLLNEFNMAFPENELKFNKVEPAQNKFAFEYPDTIVNWAIANGKKTRGHVLVWHSPSQNPKWLTDRVWSTSPNRWTRNQLLAILKNHIFKVLDHFKGRITEWDVVNEGVNLADGHPNGLRKSFWQSIIGDDYIDSAFVWAHQADPSAYLYYNEYGAEGNGSWDKAKSDSVYSLAKRLVNRGIPIHGIGLQGHFNDYVNKNSVSANIKRIGDLGLRVSITELDMMNTSSTPSAWTNILTACLENKNCTSFVTWGIDDLHSWMGKDCGCLVWDTLFKPKTLVYNALINAMKTSNATVAQDRKVFSSLPAYIPTPKPKVVNKIVYCKNDKPTPLSATGTQLKWYMNDSTTNFTRTSIIPRTDTVGTFTYYVSQTLDWLESEREAITVVVNPLPNLTHNTRTDTKSWSQLNSFTACQGENVFTGPWPNVSSGWSWKGPNGFTATTRNPALTKISSLQSGVYTATYRDANGCANSLDLTINVSVPVAQITTIASSFCAGGNLILSANTGKSYVWFKGTAQVGTSSTYTATTAGSYAVAVTNNDGCKDTSIVKTITVNPKPVISFVSPINNSTTANNQVQLEAAVSGASVTSISFYNGKSLLSTDAISPYKAVASNLINGAYTFYATGKSSAGCADTASVSVRISQITDLDQSTTIDFLTVFPNPFTEAVNINSNNILSYILFDINGVELEKGSFVGNTQIGSNLNKGVYVLQVVDLKDNVSRLKIIKH